MSHTPLTAVTLGALVAAAATTSAQTITPAQLRAACQAPGNTVTITGNLKVQTPSMPPPIVVINSGCVFRLNADSSFEADNVNVRFAGGVSFQANAKASVSLKNALWTSTSLDVNLTGPEGSLFIDESRVVASAGNATLTFGDLGVLGITGPFNSTGNALAAAGSLSVTAGQKFSASFETTRVRATTGITFSLAGPEAAVTANNSMLMTASGQFSLSSPGRSAQVDLTGGQISAPNGIAINLTGAESKITTTSTRYSATLGAVNVVTGGAGRSYGVISMAEAIVLAGGPFTMQASVGADKGEAVLTNTRVSAGANILVQTGNVGLTNPLNNRLTSPTEVRAFTGASGACIAEGNLVTAPVQAICQ